MFRGESQGRARRVESKKMRKREVWKEQRRDQGMCLAWVLSGELETHKTEATVTRDCVAEID